MKRIARVKKVLSILLCMLMIVQSLSVFALATEDTPEYTAAETVTAHTAPDPDLPENGELFAAYVEQVLYGYDMVTFGTAARAGLTPIEQGIYDALKAQIEAVALSGGSTVFPVSDISGMQFTWTNTELGVDSIEDNTLVMNAFKAQFRMDAIIKALLADCPFDLYWYDKTNTGGTRMAYSMNLSGERRNGVVYWTSVTVVDLTFTFSVAQDYQGSSTAVTSAVTKVTAARDHAKAVVEANKSKAPYEKLVAYKEYICNATSYNTAAAENQNTPYGDPWQLIYVFDNDESTTVVCEGYSKAFQYLCDLSGLDCISASGTLVCGSDSGPHMWNVVTLNGRNYLVDVTNCDAGTVGAPDLLFLVGSTYDGSCYRFTCRNQIVYFACDDLNLADENYSPSANSDVEVVFSSSVSLPHTVSGQTVTVENDICCRAGYWDEGSQKYIAITPVSNANGSYCFTAPAGVTKVLLVIAGDVNTDGRITAPDIARLNAYLKGKTLLTAEVLLAADADCDGRLGTNDISMLSNAIVNKVPLQWNLSAA